MNHPKSWLKYVEADEISDDALELDDMPVLTQTHEPIGSVEGLIVDSASGRPYYVVADAGGWFESKHFLVPIGQLKIAADERSLIVPLTREQVERFPGFDLDMFDELTEDSIKAINDATLAVFEPEVAASPSASYDVSWTRPSYLIPDWWPDYEPSHLSFAATDGGEPVDAGDTSPFFDHRAQPGDVLGLETGGERTYVGDTKEDEDDRRRAAEHAAHH